MQHRLTLPVAAGVIQFDVKLGGWRNNLKSVIKFTEELSPQRGSLLVLPELWGTGFDYKQIVECASLTNELLSELQNLALKYGVLYAGSLIEMVCEGGQDVFYNTLFVSDGAEVCGKYRKQQLFAPMAEDQYFKVGNKPRPVSTSLGLLAALVCYDLRFPDLAATQTSVGAKIIMVSAQWPAVRREHWQILLRARAIENQAYVVACNRCGVTGNTEFGGFSAIIDPTGKVLFEATDKEACVVLSLDESKVDTLRDGFNAVAPSPYRFADQDKFVDIAGAEQRIKALKLVGKKIVFTNGCFDILHQGHVTYLEQARKQGDFLVLGLNSDSSIQAIKGPTRPVNEQNSRARVLAAMGCVDLVVIFSEDTPFNLINLLMPDVLVKGADWAIDDIVGGKEVIANGGAVVNIPTVDNFSTTGLIASIQSKQHGWSRSASLNET